MFIYKVGSLVIGSHEAATVLTENKEGEITSLKTNGSWRVLAPGESYK